MSLLTCFYSFMTALFAALIMVPFLRQWALDRGETDQPDTRKVHETPTPRLGGIAIFLAFLFSAITFVPIDHTVRGILAGALIIFATGVVDDLTEISSKRKFAGQIAATLAMIVIGKVYIGYLGDPLGTGPIYLPAWAGIPFTVFALVGVINAINLIDGLDGLAGGLSVIALTAFALLGFLHNDPVTVMLAAALAGALLGFLKYNFYPARIFMGDTGSLVVGYLLGCMAIVMSQRADIGVSPAVPVVVLGLPILDTLWVMLRRVKLGYSPFIADRTHLHHKFLDLGFEHRFTVINIYAISLFWACSALLMRHQPEYLLLLFYIVTAITSYLALRYVIRHPERFPFLKRDAEGGIRSSVTYQRVCELTDSLLPAIKYLLFGYLALALWSVVRHNIVSWEVPALLLCGGLLLWIRPISDERQFLMLMVYVTAGLITIEVWHAQDVIFGALTVKRCGDILLGISGLLALFKIQFRRVGELFLTTADFLVLAVCTFVAIASQRTSLGVAIDGPLFRTVLLIIAVRTIAVRNVTVRTTTIFTTFMYLAFVTLVGLLNR